MHGTSISVEDMTILLIRANTKADFNTTGFDRINDTPSLESSWELKSLADAADESQVAAGNKYGETLVAYRFFA